MVREWAGNGATGGTRVVLKFSLGSTNILLTIISTTCILIVTVRRITMSMKQGTIAWDELPETTKAEIIRIATGKEPQESLIKTTWRLLPVEVRDVVYRVEWGRVIERMEVKS